MKTRRKRMDRGWERVRQRVLSSLQPLELELVRLVARIDEPTYQTIADEMNLKLYQVHELRKHLFDQFDIHSKVGLVLFGYRWRLVGNDQ